LSAVLEMIQKIYPNSWLTPLLAVVVAVSLILLVVLVFFRRSKGKKKSFFQELSGQINEKEFDLNSRILNIELRIEALLEAIKKVKEKLSSIESQISDLNDFKSLSGNIGAVSNGLETLKVYGNIYRAYDSGMQIKDLAQKFGRSNGEIELILNLRRMNS